MKNNYNAWFFNQHKYRKSKRNKTESFTDTKWINTNDRFRKLIDMESELLTEQPFLVQGNNKGFDMLLDLLGRSNYTFEDLDESLSEAYRVSLRNTMSRNVVNTHAIIFNTSVSDKRNVASENFTHYKIIDAPFNQLHFGHRDEFIRQKIHEMHITENDHYIDISDFNKSNISNVLDFCIICSINGYISNDCKIAIDDHGFKFKVGWKSSDKADFIVYKLDRCKMYTTTVKSNAFNTTYVSYETLGINKAEVLGQKCLINIHNPSYKETITTVPNFGIFDDYGLKVNELQKATSNMITRLNMKNINLDIYILKYFHEIPNVFPAVNYYDIMENKLVYDEKYEKLRTPDGGLVVESTASSENDLEICTPPITIDRDSSYTFNTIVSCLSLYDKMMSFKPTLIELGNFLKDPSSTIYTYIDRIKPKLYQVYLQMTTLYKDYQYGAIITSLVSADKIKKFSILYNNIKRTYYGLNDMSQSQNYSFDELYESNYDITVESICDPFMDNKLQPFRTALNIQANFFEKESPTRFNRPVSEQSFITLKYSVEAQSWLFTYPKIRHFHGIGNTFYINEDLTGKEIFKFFVLYTDTEDPANPYIEHFDLRTVIDFDLFYTEMTKYNGCIRYWDSESRLTKISKMLYRDYDDETCIHVLSKMLKRKIDGDSIINLYPTDINYEESNGTTDNFEGYDENTDRGPFSVNFLFYTLSLLNNNVDKLQAYFYRNLTNNKFSNRYADVDISPVLKEENRKYAMSYSQYTIAPFRFPIETVPPTGKSYLAYYGLPLLTSTDGATYLYDPYRYVLNVYDKDVNYPYIDTNGLDYENYVKYVDIAQYSGKVVSHKDTIEFGRLLTEYLDYVYDYISELQTDYKKTYNVTSVCNRCIETLNNHKSKITKLIDEGNIEDVTAGTVTSQNIIDLINSDAVQTKMNTIIGLCNQINYIPNEVDDNGAPKAFITFVNERNGLLGTLKYVYQMYGYDDNVKERVRSLYKHLKKINEPMNVYRFKKWLSEIDTAILETLDSHIAYNLEYQYSNDTFATLYAKLMRYINAAPALLDSLYNEIKSLTALFWNTNITPIISFCDKIINDVIFDMYTYDTIDVPNLTTTSFNNMPNLMVVCIPQGTHTMPPYGDAISGDRYLVFKLNAHQEGNAYKIDSFSSICEYVFFDGDTLTGLTAIVLGETNTILGSFNTASMTFIRAGSTADKGDIFYQVTNTETTVIDIENYHESFEINGTTVVNEKSAPMNYELLLGNHFTQLDHTSEFILNPTTWNPGSIDRINIENQVINRMSIADHGHTDCSHVYFKPCQVEHTLGAVNGKYFEGETVYARIPDMNYIFPIKITSVDHGINQGFMEAEVDQWNATWFEVEDKATITQLLSDVIECETIDDSVRNFMTEYSNTSFKSYYEPIFDTDVMDNNHIDCYTLPGDPLTVTSNAPYVYSRLKWMFNEDVPNRFISEEKKTNRFIYVGESFVANDQDEIKINMINHNFNYKTYPELYPVLKFEPNDHEIWRGEVELFTKMREDAILKRNRYDEQLVELEWELNNNPDLSPVNHRYEYKKQVVKIQECEYNIKKCSDMIERMSHMIYQLEGKTTWFNVISKDAAMIYIDDGHADRFSPSFISNIRDLIYTDKVDVYLYDWEHKLWIDPSTYSISTNFEDGIKIDECDDYTTDRVLTYITITPTSENFSYSNKILVYFAYDTSDIFDDIVMNSNKFNVRLKPLLVLDKPDENYDPYYNIRIRKHFDGYEKYAVTSDDEGKIIVNRIRRSGKYTDSPVFRLCDIKINYNDTDYDYTSIQTLKVKSPFTGFTTQRKFNKPSYTVTINAPIDSFVEDEHIKLMCISNNDNSSYDGNISSVMFTGVTSLNETTQVITISDSTLSNYETGSFICTVFRDDSYSSCGGVITVNVTTTTEDIYDDWVTVPTEYMLYRELPKEFMIICPTMLDADVEVILENKYIKNYDDIISEDNSGLYNPFEYYYDTKYHKRLPISDVRRNTNDRRLVIDLTHNDNVNIVKTPYMGISRYSLANIPENGVIDMTGYLPTPLSRNRYEFWVNGRCITGTKDLIILSPTSIQLCNMKSLKNFECIELIDDVDADSELMHKGNVYIDINGNTYANFKLAMLSNTKIDKQNVAFVFNTNNHTKINDYYNSIIEDPNNHDLEDDILSTITFDDSDTDYNKLFNIPTINGISLFHPRLARLGISEINNNDILHLYDKIWKHEATTNPLFFNTHKTGSNTDAGSTIHVRKINEEHWHDLSIDTMGMYAVNVTGISDNYFTLYISNTEDGAIDDTHNTVKIIPFMSTSTYILLDDSYHGLWLHSTYPNTDPIHIV